MTSVNDLMSSDAWACFPSILSSEKSPQVKLIRIRVSMKTMTKTK